MDRIVPHALRTLQTKPLAPVILQIHPANFYDVLTELREYALTQPFRIIGAGATESPLFAPHLLEIPTFSMIGAVLPRDVVYDYAEDRRVVRIYPDEVRYALQYPTVPPEGVFRLTRRRKEVLFTSTCWTKRLVGADVANRKGFTGRYVRVAVLDTGASLIHEQIRGKVEVYSVYRTGPQDISGHGTWCASCIAGRRAVDDVIYRSTGQYVEMEGMAPDAYVLSVKVLDYVVGAGSDSGIIKGVEMALQMGAKIISMSLGGTEQAEREEDDPYFSVFREVVSRGVIPVVAAGNEGPKEGTVGTPGTLTDVLTVGATDPITGEIAPYSSRGPTPWGSVKPDVVAPGGGYPDKGIHSAITGMLDRAGDGLPNRYSPIQGTCMPSDIDLGGITMDEVTLGDGVKAFISNRIVDDVVIAKWYQGENVTYEIELEDGRTIRATPEHKILVRRNGKFMWVEVKDLKEGDELVVDS